MVEPGPAIKEWQENNMEGLRYEYDLKPDDIVLDLGSYRQEFANEIRRRYGCYVECFDALDNRAAWICNGEIEMGGQYYYTSAYEIEGPQNRYKCVDILPFVRQEIALMKVNIEGGEYALLGHIINSGLMRNIKNFQVQFHHMPHGAHEALYEAIAGPLSLTHELTWRVPFVWENWRRRDNMTILSDQNTPNERMEKTG